MNKSSRLHTRQCKPTIRLPAGPDKEWQVLWPGIPVERNYTVPFRSLCVFGNLSLRGNFLTFCLPPPKVLSFSLERKVMVTQTLGPNGFIEQEMFDSFLTYNSILLNQLNWSTQHTEPVCRMLDPRQQLNLLDKSINARDAELTLIYEEKFQQYQTGFPQASLTKRLALEERIELMERKLNDLVIWREAIVEALLSPGDRPEI